MGVYKAMLKSKHCLCLLFLLSQLNISFEYESGSQSETGYKLENDAQCGQTRGGKEECTWDCEVTFGDFGQEITNPECLRDCFEDTPCVAKLLDDPTCCKDTEEALRRDQCIKSVYEKQPLVYSTISGMVGDKCFGTVADTIGFASCWWKYQLIIQIWCLAKLILKPQLKLHHVPLVIEQNRTEVTPERRDWLHCFRL